MLKMMPTRSPLRRLLLKMALRRSPLRRLLLLSRNTRLQVLQLPSQHRLRSPPAPRVVPHFPQLLLGMGLKRLSPRYLSRESLEQPLQLLNLRNPRRVSLLLGRGNYAQTALLMLLTLCQLPTKGSQPLLLVKLTPIVLACLCLLLTLRPPWTLRLTLGMTS